MLCELCGNEAMVRVASATSQDGGPTAETPLPQFYCERHLPARVPAQGEYLTWTRLVPAPQRTPAPDARVRAVAQALFEHNPSAWRTPGSEPLNLYDEAVGADMMRMYEHYAIVVLDTVDRFYGRAR